MRRILTKNGVDNTNIDGARANNFNAGRRSGIVKGALNQGNFFASSSNTIVLDSCELRLCGHRVVIDSAEYLTFYNKPSVPIRYSLVAQIIVDNNSDVSFDLHAQTSSTALVQDNLDASGSGTYELEIGRFTQLTDGTITDVVRTADLITGGAGGGDSEYIRIGTVTTNKISPELDADVDIENTINPDDNKPQTNFTFNLPTPSGTVVSVDGEEKTSINTDITPNANSENLITSGGVHDYPAIAFAESERQKSKNLLDKNLLKKGCYIFVTGKYDYNADYMTSEPISVTPNLTITVSCNGFTFDSNCGFVFFNDDVFVGYLSNGTTVATVPANANQVIYNFFKVGITKDDVQYAQLEYGSTATDYQSYNGQITHNGDSAVEFAEKEYQKSKNLFDVSRIPPTSELVITNNTIVCSGWAVFTLNTLKDFADIEIGKIYTFSFNTTSERKWIYIVSTGTEIYNGSSITITEAIYNSKIAFYSVSESDSSNPATYTNLQIEEGSVATDYQPYHGQITHNGDSTVKFAEKEYQKSKNLLQNTLEGFQLENKGYELIIYEKNQNVSYPLCFYVKGNTIDYPLSPEGALFSFTYSDGSVGYATGTYFQGDTKQHLDYTFDGSKELEKITLLNWCQCVGTVEFAQLEENDHFTGYQPYNGAIVHEQDIEPILIYDKDTKNTIGGTAYTAGLNGNVTQVISSDIKRLRFYCQCRYGSPTDTGGTSNIFELSLDNRINSYAQAMYVVPRRSGNNYLTSGLIAVGLEQSTSGDLGVHFAVDDVLVTGTDYYCYRIEGIK